MYVLHVPHKLLSQMLFRENTNSLDISYDPFKTKAVFAGNFLFFAKNWVGFRGACIDLWSNLVIYFLAD